MKCWIWCFVAYDWHTCNWGDIAVEIKVMWTCITGGWVQGIIPITSSRIPALAARLGNVNVNITMCSVINPRASEGKCFGRSQELAGNFLWEIPEIPSLKKVEYVKIIFCLWQTTHLLTSSWMQRDWGWRLWRRHAAGQAQRSHGDSWKCALGGWWLPCHRTTALLVWAVNSRELGKWQILFFNLQFRAPAKSIVPAKTTEFQNVP